MQPSVRTAHPKFNFRAAYFFQNGCKKQILLTEKPADLLTADSCRFFLFSPLTDGHGTYIPTENPMRPPVLNESKPQAPDEFSIRCEPNGTRVCFQWYLCSVTSSGIHFFMPYTSACANACSRSAIISSTCSIPTDRRISPGEIPASTSC